MTKLSKWLKNEKKNTILNEIDNLKTNNPSESWELFEEIGDGNFGTVYKARCLYDKDLIAAAKKIPLCEDEDDEQYTTELLVLSECNHPAIVKLLDSYLYGDHIYLMLEYCDLGAMDSVIEELDHGLEEGAIKIIIKQTLEGLEYLHSRGIIHRDIKAGNLLLSSEAIVKITDFGVSAKNRRHSHKRTSHVGTPYWMSPEVIVCETLKDGPYSYLADIWSLGITQLELAEMNPPYHDLHPARVLLKVPKSPPPSFLHPEKWSQMFADFLSKCLVKEPKKRYSSSQLLKHKWILACKDNKALRMVVAELGATVTETIVEAQFGAEEPSYSLSTQSLHQAYSPPSLRRALTTTALPRNHSTDNHVVRAHSVKPKVPKYGVAVLPRSPMSAPNLVEVEGHLPGLARQVGLFKQNSELNLNSSMSYIEIPHARSDKNNKLYRRTRSRKFVIDGEELVRHTEDIIGVRDENKTPYRQRIFRLRKEVEREYNILRKAELKEQRKHMLKWKFERENAMKAQRTDSEALHKQNNALLEKTHKDRKKELEKQEKQHNLEFVALVEVLKKEKNRLSKEVAHQTKIQKRSLKRGIAPNLMPLQNAEEELRLDQYERQDRLGHQHKQTMMTLETKYLCVTRDIVLNREKELNEIEMMYCQQLFEMGIQQLGINFSRQVEHNIIKHQKEKEFTRRTLALEEAELLKQQEVDRKNVPRKIKDDKKRRLDVVKKSVALLKRAERKNFLDQFKVEQKDREAEIWKEVKDVQTEQMINFQRRKTETLNRCRQIQLEVETKVGVTEKAKRTERSELFDQEKRKIMKNYAEKVEEFEERHEINKGQVETYYKKVGSLPASAYTPVAHTTLHLSYHSSSRSSTISRDVSSRSVSVEKTTGKETADHTETDSVPFRLNDHFAFLNEEDTTTDSNLTSSNSGRPATVYVMNEEGLPPPKPQKPTNYSRGRLFSEPAGSSTQDTGPEVYPVPSKPQRTSSTVTRIPIERQGSETESFARSAFQMKNAPHEATHI